MRMKIQPELAVCTAGAVKVSNRRLAKKRCFAHAPQTERTYQIVQ